MRHLISYVIILFILGVECAQAEVIMESVATDTMVVQKRSFKQKFVDFFTKDCADSYTAPSRFRVVGGPFFESTSGVGASLVAAGQFRFKGCDSTSQASTMQLSGSITTKKFWDVMLKGTLNFPGHDFRLHYLFDFEYLPSYYWGVGYENGNNPDNKTMQHKHDAVARLDMLFSMFGGMRIGPVMQWNYMKSGPIEKPELLYGQDRFLHHYGIGGAMEYDTRDVINDAKKGVYAYLCLMFRPKFLWNKYAFTSTEFRLNHYTGLWKNATLASEVCGEFNFGDPSWNMMSQVGNRYRMRGYYMGRYRDKHMWNCQLELRQRIWRRYGVVAWVGGGNVFHDSESFKHFLPNYGLGLRFELMRRMNVRFDFGFAKGGQTGFMFNINEAF